MENKQAVLDCETGYKEACEYINYLESLINVILHGQMPEDITIDHLHLLGYYVAYNRSSQFAKGGVDGVL